nr:pentatricopeptide repeat-containing protein At4g31070, mitochondrial-like [Quercus suber]POF08076.1 pentatricopeptide repeat-containing protein, mitochondrial [Quercus suber]
MISTWPRFGSSIMRPLIRRFSSTVDPTLSIPAIHCKIRDYVSEGLYNETLELYKEELHPLGLHATTSIFIPSIIKACSHAQSYHFGLQLHCMALKTGSDSEAIISNSLVSMYAKFSITGAARQVFDTMPHRDTISWNSMINCYLQNGYCGDALEMFKEMYMCGFEPKPELIAAVVSACAKKGEFRLGRQIHGLVIVDGMIKESVFLSTALVDFYLRCHDSLVALRVFEGMENKNEVSWTAMISGCTANQNYDMAINCFQAMQVSGVKPNRVTLLTVLPAFAELGYIEHGKEIHGYAFRHGFDADHHFSAALIHMYCKFQETLHSAEIIFEKSIIKDVVMWSLIIGSYAQSRNSGKAMNLFSQMQMQGIEPNSVTLLAILSVCTSLSSLKHGCGVHGYILKSGLNFDIFIGNALINMYAKCGCLMASHQIFKEMPTRDCTSWSTLISGYGLHGCGEEALQLFHEMQDKGMKPDSMTFLALLSTCNHTGLVEEGRKIFDCVMKDDKIPLTIEHYACFIDLLGRSGKLDDACEVVRAMPMKPSTKIWSSLVSACKVNGRLEIAEKLALWLIESEPDNAANYTMLSMVYAEAGNWPGVEEVRRLTRVQGLKKCYAFSRIELEYKSLSSSRNNQQL